MDVHGTLTPGWEGVRDAFVANFDQGLELGASVHVTVAGAPVVDLWAGAAAPDGRPWAEDTIVNVYSTTKTMCATALMMLIDRGQVDPAEPVATYWPEFAQGGKQDVTVRHVLTHSAGLHRIRSLVDHGSRMHDWDHMVEALAEAEPAYEPGTRHGYHALTYGWLVGEIVPQPVHRAPDCLGRLSPGRVVDRRTVSVRRR